MVFLESMRKLANLSLRAFYAKQSRIQYTVGVIVKIASSQIALLVMTVQLWVVRMNIQTKIVSKGLLRQHLFSDLDRPSDEL
jgi:hypothetical protein